MEKNKERFLKEFVKTELRMRENRENICRDKSVGSETYRPFRKFGPTDQLTRRTEVIGKFHFTNQASTGNHNQMCRWMKGPEDTQATDVHYRSLTGK